MARRALVRSPPREGGERWRSAAAPAPALVVCLWLVLLARVVTREGTSGACAHLLQGCSSWTVAAWRGRVWVYLGRGSALALARARFRCNCSKLAVPCVRNNAGTRVVYDAYTHGLRVGLVLSR